MALNDDSKGQFNDFQLDPSTVGDDWAFSGDEALANRPPGSKISNPQYYFVGKRYSADRTRTVFGHAIEQNPKNWDIGDGELGHGVNWALFNYNPYGGRYDGKNPNFRVMNDWLKITGLGDINVPEDGFSDKDEVAASGMVQYRNYPTEGYSSFGKKSGGASGDKRWKWQGNTWVPGADPSTVSGTHGVVKFD